MKDPGYILKNPIELAASGDTGSLGLFQLKRLWSSALLERGGEKPDRGDEWLMDSLVMDTLGLGKPQAGAIYQHVSWTDLIKPAYPAHRPVNSVVRRPGNAKAGF